MGGISIWQLLIILVIVVLLFGTKRLKGMGADLGNAVKGFKKAVSEDEADADFVEKKAAENKSVENKTQADATVIPTETKSESKDKA